MAYPGVGKGWNAMVGIPGMGTAGALIKQPWVAIFDETVSTLDQHTAEHFAETINRLKGKATILFITHHVPGGLQVDEGYPLRGREGAMRMELVEEGVMGGKE